MSLASFDFFFSFCFECDFFCSVIPVYIFVGEVLHVCLYPGEIGVLWNVQGEKPTQPTHWNHSVLQYSACIQLLLPLVSATPVVVLSRNHKAFMFSPVPSQKDLFYVSVSTALQDAIVLLNFVIHKKLFFHMACG